MVNASNHSIVDSAELTIISGGSNEVSILGNPRETILKSRLILEQEFGRPVMISHCYRTPAFPKGSGPEFINACFATDSLLPADEVLEQLHAIEARAGRVRTKRWGARTLDLDLICSGGQIHPSSQVWKAWADLPLEAQKSRAPQQLILPHPRLQDRAFVLVPMSDLAPNWEHPVLGKTVQEMLDVLPLEDRASVVRIDG